ncbi:hypothetical protein BGZ60DRAFT_266466 [Tricladium varicosporioides]|nr:hypothetical protein BGZ60DRAFT_266466 [Hymenoscyphus varicosporioides]
MSIQFTQQDLSYRINPLFASHQLNSKPVESTLSPHRYFTRSGDYWDLNVWIVEDATALNDDGTVGRLNGYADFPDATKTAILKGFDGIVIRWGTLPGTSEIYQGKTLVHEIGHWLGLRHVFDEAQMNLKVTSPCIDSNSDEIADTKQYPAGKEKWDPYQIPCGENASEPVTNYMSYSTIRGNGIGFKTGQKARAFSKYLGVRKGLLNQQDCMVSPTKKRGIESFLPNNILEQLRQANIDCASEWNTPIVDISLQAPPDPKNPYYPVVPLDPTKPAVKLPFDPATLPKPAGSQCGTDVKTGATNPIVVQPNTAKCPNPCNVHSNTCHRPTAQTCIYPNPFVSNPRAACACRPGMRAAADPLDTTKHWRLPIKGLEGYVWVAEGVECGTPCNTPTGVDICREVTVLDKSCIG